MIVTKIEGHCVKTTIHWEQKVVQNVWGWCEMLNMCETTIGDNQSNKSHF